MLVCTCLAAALSGCGPSVQPLRVWAADDMVHLTGRTPASAAGPAWEAEAAAIKLFCAANETVSFQLIVDAVEDLDRITLSAGPLAAEAGQIAPESIRLFRMLPVAIDRYPAWYLRLAESAVQPARFYDALVPIDHSPRGKSFDLLAGGRLAVWVDVHVPRQALAGEYLGAVTVRYGSGRRASVSVQLKVYDFVLPDARPIAFVGGFAHETIFRQLALGSPAARGKPHVPARLDTSNEEVRAALAVIRKLMRLAREHRLDLFDKAIRPRLKRDTFGAVVLDWEDYDNIVRPYLDGTAFDDRIGVAAWPAPLWLGPRNPNAPGAGAPAGWPAPQYYGGVDGAAYRDTAAAVLSQTVKHFEALGMSEKLFLWPRAGRSGQSGYRRHAALARLARSAGPEVPILTTLSPTPPPQANLSVPEDFPRLADMFAPPADMFVPGEVAGLARRGRPLAGLWLRPGSPPYLGSCGVLALPADVRALPWVAMKYNCLGLFLPEVLNWSADPYRSAGGSEDRLFYPGEDGAVLPSVRLKRLRRGLQDAAYLWLLRQRQRPAVARSLIDIMVHYAALDAAGDHYLDPRLDGWVRDGSLWSAARKLLAEEVAAAVHAENVSNRKLLALGIARRQLAQQACRVRVERIRSRFERDADGLFRAAIDVELYNEMVRPVDATVRMGTLPPGWQAVKDSRSVVIAGSSGAVVGLSARGDHIPTGFDAKMRIPLTLTTDLRQRRQLTAHVPFLLAGAINGPISIDGDLSDWPLRPGNTAANFKLLGRRGQVGDGLANRQTAVFALHDEENLYLAFRCDEPDTGQMVALPNNIVRHEQLMACGEDLVEVIFDPGGRGRSAEDLYHLAVKCNGVVLTERGVNTDPPLGLAGPWPVTPKVAVTKHKKLWIVELSVPLKAFGSGTPPRLWGVNFARFATAEAEASSWAGAARYFYSPMGLGTMYLGAKPGRPGPAATRPSQ